MKPKIMDTPRSDCKLGQMNSALHVINIKPFKSILYEFGNAWLVTMRAGNC